MTPYILSIDTATERCSLAIHRGAELVCNTEVNVPKSHSTLLVTLIHQLIGNAAITLSDLSAIAISHGPGSYTGLRIGASTAKGLTFALGIPLIPINTLQAMAISVVKYFNKEILFAPMLDARRMEVYTAVYDIQLHEILPPSAHILTESSFSTLTNGHQICVFGDGATKAHSLLPAEHFIYLPDIYPSANSFGVLAFDKFNKSDFQDPAYYEPLYLKEFYSTQKLS